MRSKSGYTYLVSHSPCLTRLPSNTRWSLIKKYKYSQTSIEPSSSIWQMVLKFPQIPPLIFNLISIYRSTLLSTQSPFRIPNWIILFHFTQYLRYFDMTIGEPCPVSFNSSSNITWCTRNQRKSVLFGLATDFFTSWWRATVSDIKMVYKREDCLSNIIKAFFSWTCNYLIFFSCSVILLLLSDIMCTY